jgi:hypothetical protein
MSDVESYLPASSSPYRQSPALFTQGAIIVSWWLFGVEDGVVVKPNTAGVNRSQKPWSANIKIKMRPQHHDMR